MLEQSKDQTLEFVPLMEEGDVEMEDAGLSEDIELLEVGGMLENTSLS